MTQATDIAESASRTSDVRAIGLVSAAHFVSHYYIILLPPLFAFVRSDYNVSYTELGLAITAFNITSAVLQTPAGFLVDRLGARVILIAGLLIGGFSYLVAGLFESFWLLVAMFALSGVGNSVYHPADYALLARYVSNERTGQAYSVHTFAGLLGGAVAPASLLLMQSQWGWRGAFIASAMLGFAVAAMLFLVRDIGPEQSGQKRKNDDKAGWSLLFSWPILLNLAFFTLLALIAGGLQYYSVVALVALHGTPVATANYALTGYLMLSALGVLAGGIVVTHTSRHGAVATVGLIISAATSLLLAFFDFNSLLLIFVMSFGGFFYGVMLPSRDLIVRDVTPPGAFGRVFGFITTGFNIGGIITPLIFGAVMDHGSPRSVFVLTAAFCVLSIFTVVTRSKAPPQVHA